MTDEEGGFNFEFIMNEPAVRTVHRALCCYLEHWPGGDPMEQVSIQVLKDDFFRACLEYDFEKV